MDMMRFQDPSFWNALAPGWRLGEDGPDPSDYDGPFLKSTADQRAERLLLIRKEGYLHGTNTWAVDPEPMASLVRHLDELGIPPVFALIYDPFWTPFFQLHRVIEGLLGGKYKMLPDCWVWNVDPSRKQSGWKPHRDRDYQSLRQDGSPKSITVWIPLTCATPLNSCIYILPANCDPCYGNANDSQHRIDVAAIRALPAEPGDYLIWNQAVLHWGSRSSPRAEESRVSIAWEFERANEQTVAWEPLNRPCFQDRLRLIARQLLHYARPGFASVDQPFMQWAEAISRENSPVFASETT